MLRKATAHAFIYKVHLLVRSAIYSFSTCCKCALACTRAPTYLHHTRSLSLLVLLEQHANADNLNSPQTEYTARPSLSEYKCHQRQFVLKTCFVISLHKVSSEENLAQHVLYYEIELERWYPKKYIHRVCNVVLFV